MNGDSLQASEILKLDCSMLLTSAARARIPQTFLEDAFHMSKVPHEGCHN